MIERERRLGVDDEREGVGDPIESPIVGGNLQFRGDVREHVVVEPGRAETRPEGAVALEIVQRVDQIGIEPASAPLARHRQRVRRSAVTPEDLHDLGEADDPREERRLVMPQAVGIAAAVPVFVHRADGIGHALGEADHARDLGAALAPHGEDPFAAAARPEHREAAETAQPRDERAALADVLPGVGELFGHAPPVAQPHGALHFVIAAAEEIVDHRRVARAAGVFQEKRVEQLCLLRR